MNKIKAFLTKRIYGIPVGILFALFAGGLLYYAIKMPAAEETVDETDTTENDTAVETGDVEGDTTESGSSNVIFSASPTSQTIVAATATDTNQAWGQRVRAWIVQQGGSVEVAEAVVSKYLNGTSLTAAEAVWKDKAVVQFGFPPEDIDYAKSQTATTTYTGPASKQGTPPLTHTVKGTTDNTWFELSRLYYGTTDAEAIRLLHSANPGLQSSTTKPFAVGTKVKIPKWHAPTWYRATTATRTAAAIAKKNGTTSGVIEALNPSLKFPVKAGTRVRVS